jgi:hypothetical protein
MMVTTMARMTVEVKKGGQLIERHRVKAAAA